VPETGARPRTRRARRQGFHPGMARTFGGVARRRAAGAWARLPAWPLLCALGLQAASGASAQPEQRAVAASAAPAERAAVRFPVLEFRVRGNTALAPAAIEQAVTPFLGIGKTADDVQAAARALEAAYEKAGYRTVAVNVPPQNVDSGVLTLEVAEASVGRLRVTGARFFLPSRVREGAPSLAEGKVPQFGDVERDIVALNRFPDRRVVPDLRAGAAPGTVDVDLKVEDTFPLHASTELNNQQTRSTRELRSATSITYANLFQRGDSANIAYQFAPQRPSDVSVVSGSYTFRVPNSDVSILGTYIRSNSGVGTVGGTTVIGRGSVLGLRAIVPLPSSDGFFQTLTVGGDRKSFREGIVLGTRTEFPIEYYPFAASYNASWLGERNDTEAAATLTWAFRGLGSDDAEFTQRRANASPSFAHFRAEASHLRRLENGMQLYGRVEGQAARDPLLSNEQFALGGVQSVRGYFEVEALGDYGISTQVEVRSPSLASYLPPRVNELRLHGFVDAGTAGIYRPTQGQQRNFNLVSAGVGARTKVFDYLNGAVEGATLLTDGADRRAGEFRTLFRLWGEF
jgi:hemolysin activation/secretion protein